MDSIMSHVSIGTNDFDRAVAFYDAVLPAIGARRLETFPGAAAYGRQYPEFWVQTPADGGRAASANGIHFATPDGEPGPRPHYGPAYYGCFVRDLDGHKIEAMFWDESKA
jgi:catechol 2,3-dioxygenase-like lactoylglutathione lyase family enzyme